MSITEQDLNPSQARLSSNQDIRCSPISVQEEPYELPQKIRSKRPKNDCCSCFKSIHSIYKQNKELQEIDKKLRKQRTEAKQLEIDKHNLLKVKISCMVFLISNFWF